jgi:Flp pilus assembly protein TadG
MKLDRKGSTAAITAVLATSLIGVTGIAVDSTRIWLVESRLKTAVDAAALTAARRLNEASRDADATAVFWGHFTQPGGAQTFLGATISAPVIQPDATNAARIRVTASASVPMTLMGLLNAGAVTRTESATVERAGMGLELAIVLDQTSSMRASAGSGQGTKLDAAKAAVRTLLDVLYAGQDMQPNLWVSVVPFARTINIGTGNAHMLNTTNPAMPTGWSLAGWSGCVEARLNGHDITDAAPTTDATRFRPYFWPSTWRQVGTLAGTSSTNVRCNFASNAYPAPSGQPRFCHGDNDWAVNGVGPSQADLNGNYMYNLLRNAGMTHAEAVGPNLLCAGTPIQPLTASRAAVEASVNAITAPVRSGGTTTAVGLQGAWYTLSPNWQGQWQNPNAGVPNTPNLPLPYNTPNMRKVAIILTDGDNNWQAAYTQNSATCSSTSSRAVCSTPVPSTAAELLYNAYGRVSTGLNPYNTRFPTATINPVSQTNADARLDSRFTATCNAMKAAGITIYVIGFEVASAHRTLLRNCATSLNHYLESPTPADLTASFRQIGNQLAGLRVTD